ncbi:MAG: hypothetical protein NTY38_26730 [Acidobacteria bacterium]|nr:hypothetical protein [Acidobacteriota bacterium]
MTDIFHVPALPLLLPHPAVLHRIASAAEERKLLVHTRSGRLSGGGAQ